MKIIPMLLFFIFSAGLASAFSPSDIEWDSAVSSTLHKGGTLANGEYNVKAVEFSSPVQGIKDINGNWVPETDVDPMVMLELYRNDTLIKDFILNMRSESFIDQDYEVRVNASGFTAKNAKEWVMQFYDPSASISIQKRGKPKIEFTIETDKSAYFSYSDRAATAKVTVKNTGTAFMKNLDVGLDIGGLKTQGGDAGQLHQYYYRLEKGKTQDFSVVLVVPELIDERSYNLSVSAKGQDAKELEYTAAYTASRTISPKKNYFTVSKSVKDNIYLKDTALVSVTVTNAGMFDIYNINVIDGMSADFGLITNYSPQWDIIPVMKPGERRDRTYYIRPLEANLNGFAFPAARANFTVNNRQYTATSQTTSVVVNGPKIILNKTVNKPVINISEPVTVTVSIRNAGNIGTRFEIKDILPEGASLVGGSTTMTNWSEPNNAVQYSYIIRLDNEGKVELPPAVGNYTGVEYRGTTRSVVSSDKLNITVIDPAKITPVPTPTDPGATPSPGATQSVGNSLEPTPMVPGFGGIAALMALLIAVMRR